jgi:uncharacterized protein YsxB (DUF464 family)
MIKIVVEKFRDDMSLSMTGHADYNAGNDIVCAGCSALYYALIGTLENKDAHVNNFIESSESGYAKVSFSGDLVSRTVFETVIVGLLQIEKTYPDNVSIEFK